MRKHLLRILTLVFVVCFGACLFAACGGDEDENKDDQPTTYTLTYNANGGTGADVTESHTEGEKVTLKAANTFTYSGHTFKAWNDGTKDYNAGAEFTMPASNVTLKAQWTENGETPPAPTTYKVTVTGDHVKATFDKAGPYEEGTVVTFTLTVDSGFELVSVKNGTADVVKGTDGKYSVTVGKADITITVTTKSTEQPTPQKYTVTMAANANVDFAIVEPTGKTEFETGTTVKFTVTPKTGYTVKSVKNGTTELHDTDGKYSVTVGEANIVITVETEAAQTPVAKHSVTVSGEHVTATFDAEGPYEEGTTVKFTLAVENGYEIDTVKNGTADAVKGEDDKYSVVVGNADITITVTTKKLEKGELAAEPSSLPAVNSGKTDDAKQKNGFMLWWVQGADWNRGSVVSLTPAIGEVYKEGKIAFQYKGGSLGYSVQLFYFNDQLKAAQYFLSLKVKSTVDLTITVNGLSVALKANEETDVDVVFTNSIVETQGTYAVDIQFPGTNAGTEDADPSVGIEVSEVKWYCIKGTEAETMPPKPVELTATEATLEKDANGAYFVLKGTTESTDEAAVLATLKSVYFDFQEVDGAWRNIPFAEENRQVSFADGEWTIKFDLSILPVREQALTGHFMASGTNLELGTDKAANDTSVQFDRKYTLVNHNGNAGETDDEKKANNWGAVSVKVENLHTVTSADLELDGEEGKVYFVLGGTYVEGSDTEALKKYLKNEYFDIQGNADASLGDNKAANWDRYTDVEKTVTIDTEKQEWTIKYDITGYGDKAYSIHFGLRYPDQRNGGFKPNDNAAENGLGITLTAEQATDGKEVVLGVRTFKLVNKNGETAADKFWGNLGLTVTYATVEGASVTNGDVELTKGEDSKIYLTFKGTYDGYTEEQLKSLPWYANLQHNDNVDHMGWDAVVLKNGVLTVDTEAKTWAMKYDITEVGVGCYTTHFSHMGTAADFSKPMKDSETEVTAGNKTYVLVSYNSTNADKYWGCYGVEISEIPVEEPTFTFDRNGATEGDDPEIELGEPENGVYNVTLPENPFTAPANKYFRGWEIDGVVYFPGEKVEVEPGTEVTLKAVWEELYVAYEQDVTISHTWTDAVNVIVANGAPAAELTATVSDSATLVATTDAWHGILVDINMTIKGATAANFIRLRVDGLIFAYTPDEANIGQIGKDTSKWNAEKYVALFANGGKAVQRVTASLSGRVLTYTIATYNAGTTDFTTAEPVVSVTYTVESAIDVAALTLAFYHDDGVTKVDGVDQPNNTFKLENVKVKNYISYSANQAPTADAPITVGTSDNALNYTGDTPVWLGNIKKGEKVVLKGTMTSDGAANFHAPLMYVYNGNAPTFNLRLDNWVNGGDAGNSYPVTTPNGWKVVSSSNVGSTVVDVGGDDGWWTGARSILKKADVEISFDYTGNDLILAVKATSTDEAAGDNYEKVVTYAYTLQSGTSELGDNLKIGIGGEKCYVVLTSLVRTSVKAAD